MPTCIEWGEERHRGCSEAEDHGYDTCSATKDRGHRECCDWIPCSWFCDAFVWIAHIFCVAWTWTANIVCVAWTWTTTAACVLWDAVTTVANAILVTLESIIGWVLSAVAFVIELLETIPFLGTLIRWIINGTSYVTGAIQSVIDVVLGFIGIRPEKLLRVCTVILRDENGNQMAETPNVVAMLQLAADVYKRDANIRLIPLRPFKYSSGFKDSETVDDTWVQVDGGNSDAELLDAPCNAGGEWWTGGSKFQFKVSTFCLFGSWRRVLGYGAPITVFIIRDTPDHLVGCSLAIVDYVTVDGTTSIPGHSEQSPRTIGHEIGHACNLLHTCVDDDITNLMATGGQCDPHSSTRPDRFNPTMHHDWQVLLVRASKHVTYF